MITFARRRWLALVLLGAALTLLAAAFTTTRPAGGVAPVYGQTVALSATTPAIWTFVTTQPRLTRLRVWVAATDQSGGRLSVRLSDAARPLLMLAQAEASLGAVGPDGAVDLRFEPLRAGASPSVLTTTLRVQLRLEGDAEGRVVLVGGEGAQPAFEPGYQARPFDALWPISALASSHSGVLGWPPFYALLAYCFLVALLRALVLAVQAMVPLR